MARSLNSVQLIGNLTRDPELRYTPSGKPVCDLGLATNYTYKSQTGDQKEETEFHRLVLWNKLAEIASQYLTKGAKIYVEGRLRTRQWTAQDGTHKQTTEIIVNDMIMLGGRPHEGAEVKTPQAGPEPEEARSHTDQKELDIDPSDIPF